MSHTGNGILESSINFHQTEESNQSPTPTPTLASPASNHNSSSSSNTISQPASVKLSTDTVTITSSEATKKRKKSFARACDACAIRKIKCQQDRPCGHCVANKITCTEIRIRKKSGPKKLHKKTLDTINNLKYAVPSQQLQNGHDSYNPEKEIAKVPLKQIIFFINLYAEYFYGFYPIIHSFKLIEKLHNELKVTSNKNSGDDDHFKLSSENASTYTLACSICAAISIQTKYLKKSVLDRICTNDANSAYLKFPSEIYIHEILRSKALYDYRTNLSIDTLVTAYFLFIYYHWCDNGLNPSILYLRESISGAQLLKLHVPSTYDSKSSSEKHILKKIFYVLFVTERHMCIEDSYPTVLDSIIPLPDLRDEREPHKIISFIKLVKLTSVPDKAFFDSWISQNLIDAMYNEDGFSDSEISSNIALHAGTNDNHQLANKTEWIIKIQKKLANFDTSVDSMNNHISNDKRSIETIGNKRETIQFITTKHWLRSLLWHLSFKGSLLNTKTPDCLNSKFPLILAREFLADIKNFSLEDFGVHGSSTCLMILEIANGLAELFIKMSNTSSIGTAAALIINEVRMTDEEVFEGSKALLNLFNLVSSIKSFNFKSSPGVMKLFNKIGNFLSKYHETPHSSGLDSYGLKTSNSFKVSGNIHGVSYNGRRESNLQLFDPSSQDPRSILPTTSQAIPSSQDVEWPSFFHTKDKFELTSKNIVSNPGEISADNDLNYHGSGLNFGLYNPPITSVSIDEEKLAAGVASSKENTFGQLIAVKNDSVNGSSNYKNGHFEPGTTSNPGINDKFEYDTQNIETDETKIITPTNIEHSTNAYAPFLYPGRDIPDSMYHNAMDYVNMNREHVDSRHIQLPSQLHQQNNQQQPESQSLSHSSYPISDPISNHQIFNYNLGLMNDSSHHGFDDTDEVI